MSDQPATGAPYGRLRSLSPPLRARQANQLDGCPGLLGLLLQLALMGSGQVFVHELIHGETPW
jgi:hypothetical protein